MTHWERARERERETREKTGEIEDVVLLRKHLSCSADLHFDCIAKHFCNICASVKNC